jgi:hypothetical protein
VGTGCRSDSPRTAEAYQLAQARDRRHQAEAECRDGRFGAGIGLIESALARGGLVPWPEED